MRSLKLALVRLLPWVTRYFVVSNVTTDRIEAGHATLIRKNGWRYSYLYLEGEMDGRIERVPETSIFWGPWLAINMRKHAPVAREIDELESFVMIRRATA